MMIDKGLWVIAGAIKSHGTILVPRESIDVAYDRWCPVRPADNWACLVIHGVAVTVNVFYR